MLFWQDFSDSIFSSLNIFIGVNFVIYFQILNQGFDVHGYCVKF